MTIGGSKAAKILNISPDKLLRWRVTERIKGVSCPIDGNSYYRYLISDVDKIGEEEVNRGD